MVIAVNTRFLIKDELEGVGYFILETVSRIVRDHPEHDFVLIYDRPVEQPLIVGKNVTTVVVGPPARHPLLWKWWFDIKIPSVLKKYKADMFYSADGFCSLRTKVPQCMVVHDLAFLHYPLFNKSSNVRFFKRNTRRFVKKAASIITVSEFSKRDIEKQYAVPGEKIVVAYNGVKEIFKVNSQDQQVATKEKYTEGKEYFLYSGAIHPRKNLLNLLKAFSILKKRQQTNMKLVIAGRLAWKNEKFITDLETYKYRNDVVVTGYVAEAELAALVGAAYAVVYPSLFEGFGVPVIEAMRSGVPVITSAGSAMEEIANNAALLAEPTSPTDIAEKMMLLYKDENGRKEFISKGLMVAGNYSWEKTSAIIWQAIVNCVNKQDWV